MLCRRLWQPRDNPGILPGLALDGQTLRLPGRSTREGGSLPDRRASAFDVADTGKSTSEVVVDGIVFGNAPGLSLPRMAARLTILTPASSASREANMMRFTEDISGRSGGHAMVIVAFVSLLFPGSATALCVAPGHHVAVEESNSACCAPNVGPIRGADRPAGGLASPGDCQDCTDIFLTPNSRGALLKSLEGADRNPVTDARTWHDSPGHSLSARWRSTAPMAVHAGQPLASPAPLRC
jgi:hypothetical protein